MDLKYTRFKSSYIKNKNSRILMCIQEWILKYVWIINIEKFVMSKLTNECRDKLMKDLLKVHPF